MNRTKNFLTTTSENARVFHRGNRLLFIVVAALISIFITALFGNAFAQTLTVKIENPTLKMEAICGTGWVLTILSALLFMKKNKIDYVVQLAELEMVGVFILLPSILLAPHIGFAGLLLCLLNVLISSAWMLRGHIRRVRALGVSQVWTAVWFVSLQATALFWILKFSPSY